MKCGRTPEGGLELALDPREAVVFRHLVERASFLDTPPEQQDAIAGMAERILKKLENRPADPGTSVQ